MSLFVPQVRRSVMCPTWSWAVFALLLLALGGCGDDDGDCVACGTEDAGTDGGMDAAVSFDSGAQSDQDAAVPTPDAATDGGPAQDGDVVPEPDGSYTIATWNIQNFPAATATPMWVRQVVERHRWDVIAIQEIENDAAFEALVAALPDYEGVLSFDNRAFMRNAILYRRDRVRLGEVDRIFASDGYAFPRDPLTAEIAFLDGDAVVFDFRLVVLHLKARIEEESRLRRVDAIEKLDGWVRSTTADGADPDVVLAGDFNDEVDDPAGENVFGPFLDGPYRVLTQPLAGEEVSLVRFGALIDHIIISNDAVAEYGDGTTEVVDLRSEVLNYLDNVSDHLPVVSRFRP